MKYKINVSRSCRHTAGKLHKHVNGWKRKEEGESWAIDSERDRERDRQRQIIVVLVVVVVVLVVVAYHSESAQAVPACPGEGRLEAR